MLHEGERQYLTSPGGCDCGTVLAGRAPSAEALEAELAKTAAKLRRRDWSEGKIARAVEGYRRARPGARGGQPRALGGDRRGSEGAAGPARRRAFSPLVSRRPGDGILRPIRRQAGPREAPLTARLAAIVPDEVTIFD